MFFKHPTIIRRLTSRFKTLFKKKSPEIYPEVLYPGGDCSLSIFRRFILTAHSQSENGLENAELCRITEIRGLKYLLSDRGQSEHLAVAVIKNTAKAYVIFQRFSRKPLIERSSTRSSFGSVFSSSASASTHSSSTPTLPLASVYIPEDHVSLHHYRFPSSRYPWTWSMKFKNPIPFYVALSIASAISTAFPEYHPSEENRYFLVQVFFEILKKHNADDILVFKQGGSTNNKNGSAQSGRSTDLPILSEEELAEVMARVYPVFLDELTSCRAKLDERSRRRREQQEQFEALLRAREAALRQREAEIRQFEASLAQKQESNDDTSQLHTASTC